MQSYFSFFVDYASAAFITFRKERWSYYSPNKIQIKKSKFWQQVIKADMTHRGWRQASC